MRWWGCRDRPKRRVGGGSGPVTVPLAAEIELATVGVRAGVRREEVSLGGLMFASHNFGFAQLLACYIFTAQGVEVQVCFKLRPQKHRDMTTAGVLFWIEMF